MKFSEADVDVFCDANEALLAAPDRYQEFQKKLSKGNLADGLTMNVLQKCAHLPEAKAAIATRNRLKAEHRKSILALQSQGNDRDGQLRSFVEKARGFYGLHGQGVEECPLGNALVHDVAIPYANEMGKKELTWTNSQVSEYLHKYGQVVDDLERDEFQLSHPLTGDSRIAGLQVLEIRDQPMLQQITSEFCGTDLTSFAVTNCDLRSLPTEALSRSKGLKHLDLSGNKKVTEAELNKALRGSRVETLILNDMAFTSVPSGVGQLTNLKSLEMKNCPLKSVGTLPASLTSLNISGHDMSDVKNYCHCKSMMHSLAHLDISSDRHSISARELTSWITSGPRRSSPMETLFYTSSDPLTPEMQRDIEDAMPKLQKCRHV